MRSAEEIGSFSKLSEKANNAYRIYASAYLDFVDDNIDKFLTRGMDINPLRKLGNYRDNEVVTAYLTEAAEIINTSVKANMWQSLDDIKRAYPGIEEVSELLIDPKEWSA